AWADAHFARTGTWPRHLSGPIPEAPEQTWAGVESALLKGCRGLKPGGSLYRLLKKHRKIPGPRPPLRVLKLPHPGRGRKRVQVAFPDEVLSRYQAGELDIADVARLCRVSYDIARRELARAGVQVHGPGRPPGKRPALHTKIIRRYKRGWSIVKV